jgi:hypothetical protein
MIPTSMTPAETALLQGVARDRVVYEAGSLLGHSTVALSEVAQRVISVDPHDGYPRWAPTPTWEQYQHNIRVYGAYDRIWSYRSCFQNVPVPTDAGLAWADLTGRFDSTWQFLKQCTRVPVIAIHDYERWMCEGATKAVDQYIRGHKRHIRRIYRQDTLIVLEQ